MQNQLSNRINFDDVWDAIRSDGGARVFDSYHIPIKKSFKSPFREEKTNSASVFWKDGLLIYNDFGQSEHSGNAVKIVERIEGCAYKDAMFILAGIYGIDGTNTDSKTFSKMDFKPRIRKTKLTSDKPKKVHYLPLNRVFEAYSFQKNSNHFIKGLQKYFPTEWVDKVCSDFRLCTYQKNVVFLEINQQNRICYGQIMAYQHDQLNRDKARHPYSFGKTLAKKYPHNQQIKGFAENYERCLFGEHLLKKQGKICVVESQKTALIGNLYNFEDYQSGQTLFVATSGKGNFKSERLNILNPYPITILPDNEEEAIDQWEGVAQKLANDGFQICISTPYILPESPIGWDYADAILQDLDAQIESALDSTLDSTFDSTDLTTIEKNFLKKYPMEELVGELIRDFYLADIQRFHEIGDISKTVWELCKKEFDRQTQDLPF